MSDWTDDELRAGLGRRRADAIAALYDRFGLALFRVAVTSLRSRADAEDAVQDVFLSVIRSREAVGRVENWRAYLFTALRRAAAKCAAKQPAPSCQPRGRPSGSRAR